MTDIEKCDLIIRVVSQRSGVSEVKIRSNRRNLEIKDAKHIAIWLMCKHTTMSLKAIGAQLWGADHSSVIHARNRIDDMLPYDKAIRTLHSGCCADVENRLRGAWASVNEDELVINAS